MPSNKVLSRKSTNKEISSDYKYGFTTEIKSDIAPKGLNEDIIRMISKKKEEPDFLLQWRLNAYKHWLKQSDDEPNWAKVNFNKIDLFKFSL